MTIERCEFHREAKVDTLDRGFVCLKCDVDGLPIWTDTPEVAHAKREASVRKANREYIQRQGRF